MTRMHQGSRPRFRRLAPLLSLALCPLLMGFGWGKGGDPVVERRIERYTPFESAAEALPGAEGIPEPLVTEMTSGGEIAPAPEEDWDTMYNRDPDYYVSPGDVLAFRSFDDNSISLPNATVRFDGYVSLPLIEDIRLQGMSREEALQALKEAYGVVFNDPQISLTVVSAGGKAYYVMGDVNSPREYPYTKSMNVLQAINTAGGRRDRSQATGESFTSPQGALKLAYIIRHYGGERKVIRCDLTGLTNGGPHPSQIRIWPEDVIYVPEGVNLVYIMGDAARPTVFDLVEGETLLKVLARAGGVVESIARKNRILIMRPRSETETEMIVIDLNKIYKTGQDFPIEGGDVLYISRKRLVRWNEFTSRVSGAILPWTNLYQQAYSTWYTNEQYTRGLSGTAASPSDTISVLQGLRDLGNTLRLLPVTP
jgi:polysaccharide biosynthesis/export protein